MRRALGCAFLILLGASCAPGPVLVTLVFPNAASAAYADRVTIRAFPLATETLGACAGLVGELDTGSFSIDADYVGEPFPVCRIADQPLPVLPGPHAWLAEVRSSTGTLVFTGCSVGEQYGGAPEIRVRLTPTVLLDPATTPMGGGSACVGE